MYRIRHYDTVIHPDQFKRSGWLGVLIVSLNFLRWKLEVFIQWLVVHWTLKSGEVPKSQAKELLRTFGLDVRAEALQKDQTSPLHQPVDMTPPPVRADRYIAGTPKSALDVTVANAKGLPERPKSLENLIGQYGFPIRAKKYAGGKRFTVSEDSFEPLEGPDNGSSDVLAVGGDTRGERPVGGNRRGPVLGGVHAAQGEHETPAGKD